MCKMFPNILFSIFIKIIIFALIKLQIMKTKIIFFLLLFNTLLNAQTINLTFPNGGEKFIKGAWSPHNITWESTGVSNVNIEYSDNNGTNWYSIETNYANTNYYSWNVPNIESLNCKIRITDASGSTNDVSNIFEITSQNKFIAEWNTSMGVIRAELRGDLTPTTTQNFINLAEKGFYTDLIFHRVISGFMIQDGCPIGDGTGDPGYSFDDEFSPELRHSFPGVLSMANAGANTNGSQYFITVEPTPWLDDLHTVFGRIIDGMDIVYAISEVDTDGNNKPLTDINLTINIVESNPSLTLQYPSENLKIEKGRQINILWDSDFIADAKIEFSSDNGINWTSITDSIPSGKETFTWTVPEITSSECIIKITSLRNETVFSQNVFEIRDKPASIARFELYENVNPDVSNPENIVSLGSKVRFKVSINNLSLEELTDVNLELISKDANISITSPSLSIGNIATGNNKWSDAEFEIQLPETFPGSGQYSFSLFGTASNLNDNFWLGDFNIPILNIFPFITIDDDENGNSNGNNNKILEEGETIELKLPISNKSEEILYNVFGKLTTDANYINIWDNVTGVEGIVYDTTKYNNGNPINPNSTSIQQENYFVFDYNATEIYQTDFMLVINGFLNETEGTAWDNGGVKMKWGIPKTLNSTYPPANTNDVVLGNNNNFTIMQNPASDYFLVSYNLSMFNNKLEVYDIQGRLVLLERINNLRGIKKVDVSVFKNGLYFVKINNSIKRLIVLK